MYFIEAEWSRGGGTDGIENPVCPVVIEPPIDYELALKYPSPQKAALAEEDDGAEEPPPTYKDYLETISSDIHDAQIQAISIIREIEKCERTGVVQHV